MAIFTTIQIISTISPHILATPSPICDKPKEHPLFLSQNKVFFDKMEFYGASGKVE